MRDSENIRQVAELGIDWMGMVFCDKSPRHVTAVPDGLSDAKDHTPRRVGVFVDEMPQTVITCVVNYRLDLIQLHGHESPTFIRNLRRTLDPDIRPGIRIIKAIPVSCRDDLAAYKAYADCVDYFLFDTKTPNHAGHATGHALTTATLAQEGTSPENSAAYYGGTGRQFDWSVLAAYDGSVPFLLSGGIGPDDAQRVKAVAGHGRCIGIDLNSRFETAPGLKDIDKLKHFIEQL